MWCIGVKHWGVWWTRVSRSAQQPHGSLWCPRTHPALGSSQASGGTGVGWLHPLYLSLVTLTMALGEGGTGLESLITVALEAARSVDAAAVGTESGLGAALILI